MVRLVDRAVGATVSLGRWLALPVVLLLFLQWPLRDAVRAWSREANDLGQCFFALFVAIAVTAATRARGDRAPRRRPRPDPLGAVRARGRLVDGFALGRGARVLSRHRQSWILRRQGGDGAPCRPRRGAGGRDDPLPAGQLGVAWLGLALIPAIGIVLVLTGLPAFVALIGVAAVGAAAAVAFGQAAAVLTALPSRIVNLLENDLLQALPLFVLMGALLNRLPLAD